MTNQSFSNPVIIEIISTQCSFRFFKKLSIAKFEINIHSSYFFDFYSGISSLTFTKAGEALYLHSSSELQRISLSVTKVTKAHCALNLPPNARSLPEGSSGEAQEQGTVEAQPENESELQGTQPVPRPRSITENGTVSSSST